MRLYLIVFAIGTTVLIAATWSMRQVWPEEVAAPMAQAAALAAAMVAAWPWFRKYNRHNFRFRDHMIVSIAIPFAVAAFRMALGLY